jgi:hypothetical protein
MFFQEFIELGSDLPHLIVWFAGFEIDRVIAPAGKRLGEVCLGDLL